MRRQERPLRWARLRAQCPVARGGANGDWWALTRYDDVVAAAADDRTFTSTRGVNIGEGIIGPPADTTFMNDSKHACVYLVAVSRS